ncbi:UNVERIFIED_CONTAM: hypothetical protein Cloal_2773 [Acetivibrio alkalicellulosi]
MNNSSYLKQYVGSRVVLYLSIWSRFFKLGTKGVVSDCKDGWVELKKNRVIEHINLSKVCSFKVLD